MQEEPIGLVASNAYSFRALSIPIAPVPLILCYTIARLVRLAILVQLIALLVVAVPLVPTPGARRTRATKEC